MKNGAIANPDENRMVGHYWLRHPEIAPNEELRNAISETLEKVKQLANAVHSGSLSSPNGAFTDLLVISIGGSALGPQFVGKALGYPNTDKLKVHFFDNTDPDGIDYTLSEIGDSLCTTLALVISKSGGTPTDCNRYVGSRKRFCPKGIEFFEACDRHNRARQQASCQYSLENEWLDFLPCGTGWVAGLVRPQQSVCYLPPYKVLKSIRFWKVPNKWII